LQLTARYVAKFAEAIILHGNFKLNTAYIPAVDRQVLSGGE